MAEIPAPNLKETLDKNLRQFITRHEGEKPVAPAAPLINPTTPRPLQDTAIPPPVSNNPPKAG